MKIFHVLMFFMPTLMMTLVIFRLVFAARPHTQTVERVVGIGFQPGLDPAKVNGVHPDDLELIILLRSYQRLVI